ncbi:MAG: hypothetical protein H8F28_16570 [Fibrella sp.]|nr:hypothetical protein [Armatimonadota bacterium]
MGNGFREMVRFELRYRAKSVTTYIFFAVLFILALAIMSVDTSFVSNRDGQSYINSPQSLDIVAVVLVSLSATMISAIAGIGIYRDFESNTHELFFSTRLTKAQYWYGRFIGSFLVTLIVYSAIPLGFLAGSAAPWAHKDVLGPFRADAYLALCCQFLIPDIFFISALFFVGGALTRSLLAIYTQGIVLLALWVGSISLLGSLENRTISGYLEPFGMSALSNATKYWTMYEQNSLLVPFNGVLLQNRLLWFGVGLTVLIGGYFVFDYAHSPRSLRKSAAKSTPGALSPSDDMVQITPSAPTGWRYHLTTFGFLLRFYTTDVVRSVPFLAITLTGVGLLVITSASADEVFDTPVFPVTRVVLESITGTFQMFFYALITFYVGELVWRERVLRADQTTDVLPVSSLTVVLAKLGAVVGMIATLNFVLILTGVFIQISKSFYQIDLPLYFSWLYGVEIWKFVIFALLCFFLHTVINQKFVAHLAVVLIFIVSATLREWGYERNFYHFGSGIDFVYSDMNGFGSFLVPLRWWQFYWLAAGMLLFCCALKVWIRGTDTRIWMRWQVSHLGKVGRAIAVAAAIAFLGSGTFLYYNTDVLNEYTTTWQDNKERADYERNYKKRYEKEPQPHITSVVLDVSLYPERQKFALIGTYRLKNKTKKPVREVIVDYSSQLTINKFTWSVPTKRGVTDDDIGFRTYRLDKPLAPGSEITFTFHLEDKQQGFSNDGSNARIFENGTFLTLPAPTIGYQPDSELSEKEERERYGLKPRRVMAPVTDLHARNVTYIGNDADWIAFEATVRTAPDQTAVTPGYLVKEWKENGRRCFTYRMDAPIRNFYSILSARYREKRDTWKAVDGKVVPLTIYHHPGHEYNLERMFSGVKGALSYCSRYYAPYQFRQLRILEFPNYVQLAQSFPNTIPYSEGIGFIARVDDTTNDVDYPFYVSAHETAHQWWAHQVIGGNVEGSEMLSESLSEYTSLMVMREKYGRDYLRHFLRYNLDEYLSGRKDDNKGENPLVRSQHQQYIHYNKGSLAFCALADRIGEKRLNAILSRFLRDNRFQEPPYTTGADLVAYLKQGATKAEQAYIRDLFEKITLYECRAEKATRKKLKNGKWQVTLRYAVSKFYADKSGKETPALLDDELFDVNIFAEPDKKRKEEELLGKSLMESQKVTVSSSKKSKPGTETRKVVYTVSVKPYEAGIDPYNVMIDRTPDNNTVQVEDAK